MVTLGNVSKVEHSRFSGINEAPISVGLSSKTDLLGQLANAINRVVKRTELWLKMSDNSGMYQEVWGEVTNKSCGVDL